MDALFSKSRVFSLFAAAFLAVTFSQGLLAQDSAGSAYGESVDLTIQSQALGAFNVVVPVESGPLPSVGEATPPDFNAADDVVGVTVTADVPIGPGGDVTLDVLSTGTMEVATVGDGTPQADSDASVEDLDLGLLAGGPGFLDAILELTADAVVSTASAGGSCEAGLTASGTSTLTNASLSTEIAALALLLDIFGNLETNPAPNTVLVDVDINIPLVLTGGLTIILNEQITTGDGVTSAGITVNAIRVSVDDLEALGIGALGTGVSFNGDVVISQSQAEATCPQADLEVAKTDDPDPVFVQDPLSYQVTVTNNGPDDAPNAQLVDTLPPSVNFVSAIPSQGSCMEAGLVVTCDLGLLPAVPPGAAGSAFGEFMDLSIDSSLVPAAVDVESGPLPSVSGEAPPTFDLVDDVAMISETADLQVSLPPLATDTFNILSTGTVDVATSGDDATPEADSTATVEDLDLTLLEAIPGVLELFLDISADEVATQASVAGTCGALTTSGDTTLTNAMLDSAVTELLGIVGALDVSPAPNTVLIDTPLLGGNLSIILNEQIVTGDGVDTAGITVNAIHISMSDVGVPILDPLNHVLDIDGEVIIAQSHAQADCTDDGVATVDINVIPKQPGVILNSATASHDSIDPVPDNDTDDEPTTVLGAADLSISKTDDPDPVTVGSPLTYTLTVNNAGPSDATNVMVTDTLPASVTFGSATPSQGSCMEAGLVVTCDLDTITTGGMATITIVVTPNVAGDIVNSAMVSADEGDPNTDDNSDDETTTVEPSADVSITKSDDVDPVVAGNPLTYTLTVNNAGPSDATNVTVTDTLPASVTFGSATPSQGSCMEAALVVTCDLGAIASGGMATITIVVTPQQGGDILNSAVVTADEDDPDDGNNNDDETTTVEPSADVSITKTDDVDPVIVGDPLTYTLTVNNAGPSDATNVMVTDNLPASVSFGSATPSQGSCMEAALVVTCDLGTIAASAGATITIVVAPNSEGDILNVATVAADEGDPDSDNNNDDETTTVTGAADLSLTKTDDVDPIAVGNPLTYTLTVNNAGPSDATNVMVTDNLPASVTFGSATPSQGSCMEAALVVSCNLGTIADGGMATITIVVTPNEAGDILNSAFVTGDQGDPDDGNNSDDETTTVEPSADVSITKTDDVDPVPVGDPLTYTLTVNNAGPSDATNVTVTDNLPASVSFGSATPSQGSCMEAALVVSCNLGTIANGGMATISIVVTPNSEGDILNTTTVSADEGDPNPDNNSDDETTTVGEGDNADLSIIKTDDPDPVLQTGTLTYTLTVNNAGPSDATNVMVTDNLPASVTFGSATPSQGSCMEAALVVSCNLGTIANGGMATITIVATPQEPGDILNSASVSADENDPDDGNNSDDETTTVVAAADLSVDKVASPNPVMVGELLTYTVTVENAGPSDATNVMLTDNLPESVIFESVSPSQGSCNELDLVVTCNLGTIVAGGMATVIIEVTPTEPGIITNSAIVESEVGDPEPEDNDDEVDTEVDEDSLTTFLVTKIFDDGNTAEVEVTLSCNTGLPLEQTTSISEGDPVNFVVGDFESGAMDCEVFEAVPDGYSASYIASGDSDFDADENGCTFTAVSLGDENACEITNTLQPVTVVVFKEWIDEHPEFQMPTWVEITLTCNAPFAIEFAPTGNGTYSHSAYIQPGNPGEFEVLPHWDGSTFCFATEEEQAGVLQDVSDCAFIPLVPGQGGECTIVNTRLFAGIPTLSRHGLILLTLLMLGIGALAYRRFA